MTHIVAISGAYISGARARAPAAARRVVWCGVVRPLPAPTTNPHPLARCRRRAWPKSATPRLPPGCGACARVGAPAQLPGEREGEGGWVWGGGRHGEAWSCGRAATGVRCCWPLCAARASQADTSAAACAAWARRRVRDIARHREGCEWSTWRACAWVHREGWPAQGGAAARGAACVCVGLDAVVCCFDCSAPPPRASAARARRAPRVRENPSKQERLAPSD